MKCSGVDVKSGRAVEITAEGWRISRRSESVEAARDVYLAPGFVDVQVNGFAGVDYNCPTIPLEDIARSLDTLFATGVTRFYPTVITGPREDMLAAVRNLSRARTALPNGEAIDGLHIEGPHICPEEGPRGAHPRDSVRPPDFDEFRGWQEAADGRVRIVTLSPEWPEAPAYIEKIVAAGVVAAIGHMQATSAQIADAV